jgi:hypothetical protein
VPKRKRRSDGSLWVVLVRRRAEQANHRVAHKADNRTAEPFYLTLGDISERLKRSATVLGVGRAEART